MRRCTSVLCLLGLCLLQRSCVIIGCGNQALWCYRGREPGSVSHCYVRRLVTPYVGCLPPPVMLSTPVLLVFPTQQRRCTPAMVTSYEL